MTRVIGPNGFVWDVDEVVASGLLGSADGAYRLADEPGPGLTEQAEPDPVPAEPEPEPEPVKRQPPRRR